MLPMYAEYSQIYDLIHERPISEQELWSDDKKFWVDESLAIGSPTLELACGSGRLLLPIARAGIQITGIDNSPEMLELLVKKIKDETLDVQSRVQYLLNPMQAIPNTLHGRFKLVFIAFSAFQYMYTRTNQEATLSSAYKTLLPGGKMIVDVFNPNPNFVTSWGEPLFMKDVQNSPEQGDRIAWFCVPEEYDQKTKILTMPNLFLISKNDHSDPQQILMNAKYYLFTPEELVELFRQTGFVDIETFGDYNKTPFSDNSKRIIVSGKRI